MNPRLHSETRTPSIKFTLESGALDHSAILTIYFLHILLIKSFTSSKFTKSNSIRLSNLLFYNRFTILLLNFLIFSFSARSHPVPLSTFNPTTRVQISVGSSFSIFLHTNNSFIFHIKVFPIAQTIQISLINPVETLLNLLIKIQTNVSC